MSYNLSPFYPAPTWSASSAVASQAITVTSTATASFTTTFNVATEMVIVDIQEANVWATFDGSTPATRTAHILYSGLAYTWSRKTASQVKFKATTTANAYIVASEFQI